MSMGSMLIRLREEKGLTQADVAAKLGIKRARYNAWEHDIAKPRVAMLNQLANFYGVNPDFLLGFESHTPLPEWATAKDKRDFKKMLEEDEVVMFDGVPISDVGKQRVMDVLTGLFWEAKQMNKRKK
ncbi:helix-turn-helix domain-containing protein [Paenibacillus nasutitermitis]|uniref:HTH cro/C1-type domain-containing protein n=1 Tax=Paenibacillus nasutitermitis TaxID=1652958 RepID=A0A916ZFZ5_9BACL|nr:helix-turn-helix transcriptional regulator [Paenibacillus nasutitermitis]GGD95110.1 hypothetical protein GCM10010911_62240 [Paenibacillus nasutitermitis]